MVSGAPSSPSPISPPLEVCSEGSRAVLVLYHTLVTEWFFDVAAIDQTKEDAIIRILGGEPPAPGPIPLAWIWWLRCLALEQIWDIAASFWRDTGLDQDRIIAAFRHHRIKIPGSLRRWMQCL
jgi:hypothetical protein